MRAPEFSPALYRIARAAANWRHGIFPELFEPMLQRFETLDDAAQQTRVLDLLQKLIRRAQRTVPFYQRRFVGRELRRLEDLASFPLLSREDVRNSSRDLISRSHARLGARWNSTGGSTGQPLRLLQSHLTRTLSMANRLRCCRWYGVPRGSRIAFIWGAERDLSPREAFHGWRGRLLGECALNAFHLDEPRCREFLAILEEWKPAIIYGYATALARFARHLREHSRRLRHAPIAVHSTAEVLSSADRQVIEEELRGPVFDYYGSRDAGAIAGECRARAGLHTFSDLTHVEVIRDDGNPSAAGEVGEVVVTNLHEHAMPLIRYRTGDRAAFLARRCSCGLGYPLLSSLEGRVGDFIRAPAGHEIHGEFFTHLFYGIDKVARFQVRQTGLASLLILVQACGTPDAAALERVRAASASRFGAPDVALRIVDVIEPGASGKHRFVLPFGGTP
jgi:phenylacetate-CoA ligase